MTTSHTKMTKLTNGLASKSEKMRALARAGYPRGDIARFLGTSYQFVRNVLVQEEARKSKASATSSDTPIVEPTEGTPVSRKIRVGSNGEIVIPAHIGKAIGAREGDVLIASVEDGDLHLLTMPAAVRKAQAIVRQFVPEGVSLVDELLEDRRREVERERRDG